MNSMNTLTIHLATHRENKNKIIELALYSYAEKMTTQDSADDEHTEIHHITFDNELYFLLEFILRLQKEIPFQLLNDWKEEKKLSSLPDELELYWERRNANEKKLIEKIKNDIANNEEDL